ncbi:MAG: B12-binding domain-containing radical SAM protein [Candidatus Aenigmarchaeota archaeon]|nr:B12-binding domain-containing radical SAM protein [Candidatus Aenigmarchaeota archaeon]
MSVDVLLINPISPVELLSLLFEIPFSLLILARALEEKGMEVKLLNYPTLTSWQSDHLKKKISKLDPKIVGISLHSAALPQAIKIAKITKDFSNAKICIGGPHCNADITFIHRFRNIFDYQFVGEAEITVPDVFLKILREKKVERKVIFCKLPKNLDLLPSPAYHLLEKKERFLVNLSFSRGCPFNCSYCAIQTTMKKLRHMSVKRSIEEITYVYESLGSRYFYFQDPNFTIHPKWVSEFTKTLRKEKIDIKWRAQTRCDLVNLKILKEMGKSGCIGLGFGVESFSPFIQRFINKRMPFNKIERAIKQTKNCGMDADIFLMIGFPIERKKDLFLNLLGVKKTQPTTLSISFTTPYPGTKLFHQCGFSDKNNPWDKYALLQGPFPLCKSKYLSVTDYFFFLNKLSRYPILFGDIFFWNLALLKYAYPFIPTFIQRQLKFFEKSIMKFRETAFKIATQRIKIQWDKG